LEKRPEYLHMKRTVRVVVAVIVVLLAAGIVLGALYVREMKRMISTDFNAQQLAIARHASIILEKNFKILKNELLTLALSPSIQYVETVSWPNRIKISLASVRDYGVFRIMFISADGSHAYAIDYNNAVYSESVDYAKSDFFQWCKETSNRNRIYASSIFKGIVEDSEPGLVMHLATCIYQISPDEAHPVPTQKFSGVLVFFLNAGELAGQIASPIRSGETGYAWVIDQHGNFIYHQEKSFVGQNAFEARHLKNPHISFDKINIIQKEKMLQGKEGTSQYTSGWHRGKEGSIEKLIAFAPANIGAGNTDFFWSLAVVAPVSEVQDAIQMVYFRQAGIQIAFTIAVLVILLFLRHNELIWIKALEKEVEEKTRDLSEYARRLQNSEKKYRTLVESADDLIFVLDQNCKILAMNQSWSRMTGQKIDDTIGKHISDVIRFADEKGIRKTIETILSEGQAASIEQEAVVKESKYWFDIRYSRIFGFEEDKEPGTPNVLIIARDITEHKRLESRLFNTQKLASLGELSAGVAHEINNPIAIILGFTEMLLEKASPGTREYDILQAIERQGENCKRIVENLLAFARVPKQGTIMTDVTSGLRRVIDVVKNTLLTEKIDLKSDIPDDLPQVYGDSQEIEQVFLNIINNAIAAMKDGGVLGISAARDHDNIHIAFEDTGPGIAPEHIDKIFEPFFTTKEVGEGTGLGLSVSYAIVKKIGGDILVKSRTLPVDGVTGAVFTLVLPVAKT